MRDSFNEINITPLTDIFLVLLIIMMVIAPLLDQQGLNLAVPEVVNSDQITKDAKIMHVSITPDNKFVFENEYILPENLEEFFTTHSKDYPDGLLIQAADNSEHGAIVKVMDSARNTGITSISIARE